MAVNEIVVVKDGSQYYESKILKVECFSKVWKYFVHYQGMSIGLPVFLLATEPIATGLMQRLIKSIYFHLCVYRLETTMGLLVQLLLMTQTESC